MSVCHLSVSPHDASLGLDLFGCQFFKPNLTHLSLLEEVKPFSSAGENGGFQQEGGI